MGVTPIDRLPFAIAGELVDPAPGSPTTSSLDGSVTLQVAETTSVQLRRALRFGDEAQERLRRVSLRQRVEAARFLLDQYVEQRARVAWGLGLFRGIVARDSEWMCAWNRKWGDAFDELIEVFGGARDDLFRNVASEDAGRGAIGWLSNGKAALFSSSTMDGPATVVAMCHAMIAGTHLIVRPSFGDPATHLAYETLLENGLADYGQLIRFRSTGDATAPLVRQVLGGVARAIVFSSNETYRQLLAMTGDPASIEGEAIQRRTRRYGTGLPLAVVTARADLDRASRDLVEGARFGYGRFCLSTTPVLVERACYPELLAKVVERGARLQHGAVLDATTDLGQHRSEEAAAFRGAVQGFGGRVAFGRIEETTMDLMVLADVSVQSACLHQEFPGPLLCLIPVDSIAAAAPSARAALRRNGREAWTAVATYGDVADRQEVQRSIDAYRYLDGGVVAKVKLLLPHQGSYFALDLMRRVTLEGDAPRESARSLFPESREPVGELATERLTTYFKHLFAHGRDMMNLFSLTQQKILMINGAARDITGYELEELREIPIQKLYPPEELPKLMQAFERLHNHGSSSEKLTMLARDGSRRQIWTRSYIVQYEPEVICLVHTIDVTEEKTREEKALAAAKLATLGEASAVLAHELGNALQSMQYNLVSLARAMREPGEREQKALARLQRAVTHMDSVVQGVQSYARNSSDAPGYISIVAAVHAALALLAGHFTAKSIELSVTFEPELPLVCSEPSQVQQIMLILMKNAIQAMAERPIRRLTLTARRDGAKVLLELRDTGGGIPEDLHARVFEAFSSTKPIGMGMGLGLSIASRLAGLNGVELKFESVPSEGTTFCLGFQTSANAASPDRRGGIDAKTLLLFTDSPMLLTRLSRPLAAAGARLLAAQSSAQALEFISSHSIDAVLCEDAMYPVTGSEFAELARANYRGAICLIASTPNATASASSRVPIDAYLDPSFDEEQLLEVVAALSSRA